MAVVFEVIDVSAEQARQAFPVIQATWPASDLASWQHLVHFFNGRKPTGQAGVMAIRDPAGYIFGVLAYQLDRELRNGLVFSVRLFAAVDLANSRKLVRTLLDVAEMRAAELGCASLQICLYKDQKSLASRLRALGLAGDAEVLRTKVDLARSRN